MSYSTNDIAECGAVSITIALLPTIGLFISELMPYLNKKEKCNGIIQTFMCFMNHLINKEPCNTEEIQNVIECINTENEQKTTEP
tara:strand:+ start:4822 stop:5076 length:255 start_codon:yes stop_codon:yes gene_type:complete